MLDLNTKRLTLSYIDNAKNGHPEQTILQYDNISCIKIDLEDELTQRQESVFGMLFEGRIYNVVRLSVFIQETDDNYAVAVVPPKH
jgi:hypothetical protein